LTAAFAGPCVLLLTAVAFRWAAMRLSRRFLCANPAYPHPLDLPGRPHGQCPDCPTGLLPALEPDLEAGQTARSACHKNENCPRLPWRGREGSAVGLQLRVRFVPAALLAMLRPSPHPRSMWMGCAACGRTSSCGWDALPAGAPTPKLPIWQSAERAHRTCV
jgi:hypothetical protein